MRGGLVVLMSRFDPEQALQLIEAHRVQWANLVPTMLHRIWRLPEEVRSRYDLSSLRRVVSSGAPCADWLMRSWIEWIGADRMFELCDLRSIEDTLRERDDVVFFSNENDFLLRPEDITWARATFGERCYFFGTGGHLGNLYRDDIQAAIRVKSRAMLGIEE